MTTRKIGRPTKIDAVVDVRTDTVTGDTVNVTVADRILELLRQGAYHDQAALAAGIDKVTFHHWLRTGARCAQDLHAGRSKPHDLTRLERLTVQFSHAVAVAEAEYEAGAVERLDAAARGGTRRRVVTERRDANNVLVERHVRIEEAPPDARIELERLARKFPQRWGPNTRVELSGPAGGPIEIDTRTPQERAVAELDALADRLAAIDTSEVQAAELEPGADE